MDAPGNKNYPPSRILAYTIAWGPKELWERNSFPPLNSLCVCLLIARCIAPPRRPSSHPLSPCLHLSQKSLHNQTILHSACCCNRFFSTTNPVNELLSYTTR